MGCDLAGMKESLCQLQINDDDGGDDDGGEETYPRARRVDHNMLAFCLHAESSPYLPSDAGSPCGPRWQLSPQGADRAMHLTGGCAGQSFKQEEEGAVVFKPELSAPCNKFCCSSMDENTVIFCDFFFSTTSYVVCMLLVCLYVASFGSS
jgi:hypothetical protein